MHYVWGNSSKTKTHYQPIKGALPTKGSTYKLSVSFLILFMLLVMVSDSDGLIESPDKPMTTLQAYKNKNITQNIKLQ
jgi:hypothetical protein